MDVNQGTNNRSTAKSNKLSLGLRSLTFALLFGVLIILIALIVFIAIDNNRESSYVNTNDFQSVFVNVTGSSGGQAYFGHISAINSNYLVLDNVFYLEPGATSNQFTLNNLSCAIYNPSDQMIINRSQVDFWENLKANSQVTQDINKWSSEHLACAAASSTASSTSSTSTTTTPTTPSTSTTTK